VSALPSFFARAIFALSVRATRAVLRSVSKGRG
jgi:hypothetical protein